MLAGAQHGRDRGGRREQADDDGGVGRGEILERERAEQRPAEDDAEHDETEPEELLARGKRRARGEQDQRRGNRRQRLPPDAHEHRIQLLDGDPGGRQREAEGQDAEEAEEERHRGDANELLHAQRDAHALGLVSLQGAPEQVAARAESRG